MPILGQEAPISLLSSLDTKLGGRRLPDTEPDPGHPTGVAHAGCPLTTGSKEHCHSFDKRQRTKAHFIFQVSTQTLSSWLEGCGLNVNLNAAAPRQQESCSVRISAADICLLKRETKIHTGLNTVIT